MVLIIGLSLSFIAIGVLYYLNNELKKKLENNNRALLALQKEFTQYQVDESRVREKNTARMEIRHDNIAKSIRKNEDASYANKTKIDNISKELPDIVGKFVSQVEFAQNTINRNK